MGIAADDLARIVTNLLDNCLTHAPSASIALAGISDGRRYRLYVIDDGPGIAAHLWNEAFERDVSSRNKGGLGLFSVRSLVESCGGSVHLDRASRGTSICVELPLAGSETASSLSAAHGGSSPSDRTSTTRNGRDASRVRLNSTQLDSLAS